MKKKSKVTRGDAKRATLNLNCLLCVRWNACSDPNKAVSYACSKFRPGQEITANDLEALLGKEEPNTKESLEEEIVEADDENSIADMIDRILDSGVPVPPDLRINDQHIKRPKNIYAWMTEDRFMGSQQPPFARQIQVGLTYFAEYCPRCSDMEFFECIEVDTPLDDIADAVAMLRYGKCPDCGVTKSELVAEEELNDYTELGGLAGQRSTKTSTVSIFEAYNTCRWLTTPNIPDTYKILPSTVLFATYTATTFSQAKENFWEPLSTIFATAPWYLEYHRFLNEIGRKHGEELYAHTETILRYRHKNMLFSPVSPSKRTMRGRTRISAVIDEYSWFPAGLTKTGKNFERLDAKEVYTALKRSMSTMRAAYRRRVEQGYSNLPKPLFSNISSPSSKNDALMTLYRQAQGSKEIFVFKYATWEFNPLLTKEDFAEEFRLHPVEAERDYACNPPLGSNSWIDKLENIVGSFSDKQNGIKTVSSTITSKSGKKLMSSDYKTLRKAKSNFMGVMALDAGYSNNSFAFAIMYPDNIPNFDDEEDDIDVLVKTTVHLVGEVIPKKDIPISFSRIFKNILLPLCNEFNVGYVVSDRWQNIKMMQDLEEAGEIAFIEHKLLHSEFSLAREAFYDKAITLPKTESDPEEVVETTLDNYPQCFYLKPVDHLLYQLMTVQDTGSTVIKGDGSTDDILRCVVLGHTILQMPDILENLMEEEGPTGMAGVGVALGKNSQAVNAVSNFGISMSTKSMGMQRGGSSVGIAIKR